MTAPDKVPGAAEGSGGHAHEPGLWLACPGSRADPLKSVSSGLDLAHCGAQRAPQCDVQAVLGCGHALTSLPAAS